MTDLDPSIILAGRPVQIADPVDLQEKGYKLRDLALQSQTAQQDYQDKVAIRDIYKQSMGPDGNLDTGKFSQLALAAGLGQQAGAAQAAALERQKTQADIGQMKAKTGLDTAQADKTTLDAQYLRAQHFGDTLHALVSKPNLSQSDVIGAINDSVNKGYIDPQTGAQWARNLPGDPNQMRGLLIQKANETQSISQQIKNQLDTAPKYNEMNTGGAINQGTVDPMTGQRTAGQNVKLTPTPGEQLTNSYEQQKLKAAQDKGFAPDEGELLGALALHGVQLPAGLRSKDQMKATVRNLIDSNPGKSMDEIAQLVGNGQINFGSDKKAATVAAGQEGKVATAVNELGTFGDQALAASAAVPRGSFVPANKLMQMADSAISDPNLLTLKLKLNALNNAYNVLSARGGTDAGSREHVAKLFSSANSPEGVAALVKGLKEEGAGAKSAAAQASHVGSAANATDQPAPAGGVPAATAPASSGWGVVQVHP